MPAIWDYDIEELKKTARTNLYIDGTNLFAGQNQLFGPKNHLSFSSLIPEIKKLFKIDKIFFYASYLGAKCHNKNLLTQESEFYKEAKKIKNIVSYKGHRSSTSGKEKGVDVHLAADMISHAFSKEFDQAVIMTGDADLIYPQTRLLC